MNNIESIWVVGVYKGERAKSIKLHAEKGVGYYIRSESGRGDTLEVEAAFRWVASNGPLPEYLLECDPFQVKKLEALRAKRLSER